MSRVPRNFGGGRLIVRPATWMLVVRCCQLQRERERTGHVRCDLRDRHAMRCLVVHRERRAVTEVETLGEPEGHGGWLRPLRPNRPSTRVQRLGPRDPGRPRSAVRNNTSELDSGHESQRRE